MKLHGYCIGKQWLYEKVFNEHFNIVFFKPKKDLCDLCEMFKNSSATEREEMASQIEHHLINKARNKKELDKMKAQEDKSHSLLRSPIGPNCSSWRYFCFVL